MVTCFQEGCTVKPCFNIKGAKVGKYCQKHKLDGMINITKKICQYDNCDFAILWRYDHIYEKYNLSMRSNNKVDVSEICKKFGGGGHKNAAGCSITKHPIKVFSNNEEINKLINFLNINTIKAYSYKNRFCIY